MYREPCSHLKMISNDQQVLLYPRERIVRSCGYLRDLDDTYRPNEIPLDFSAQQIETFLNFLETEKVPETIERAIDVALVADFLHLDRLNCILETESQVIQKFYEMLYKKNPKIFNIITVFLREQGLSHHVWSGLHYYLTHLEEVKAVWEKEYQGSCMEGGLFIWNDCSSSESSYSDSSYTDSTDSDGMGFDSLDSDD